MPERMSLADAWHMPVKHTQALLLPGVFRKQQSPRALGMHFGCFTSSRRVLSCSQGGFLLSTEPGEHSSHPIPGRRASHMLFLYSPALLQLKYPPGGRTSTLTRAKTPCRPCTSLPKSWITPALRSRGSSGQAGSSSRPLHVSPPLAAWCRCCHPPASRAAHLTSTFWGSSSPPVPTSAMIP